MTEDTIAYYKFPYKEGDEPQSSVPLDSVTDLTVNGSELRFKGRGKKNQDREFQFKSDFPRDVTKWKEAVGKQLEVFNEKSSKPESKEEATESQKNEHESGDDLTASEPEPAEDSTSSGDANAPKSDNSATEPEPEQPPPASAESELERGPSAEALPPTDSSAPSSTTEGASDEQPAKQVTSSNEDKTESLEEHNQIGGFHSPEKPTPVPPLSRSGSIIVKPDEPAAQDVAAAPQEDAPASNTKSAPPVEEQKADAASADAPPTVAVPATQIGQEAKPQSSRADEPERGANARHMSTSLQNLHKNAQGGKSKVAAFAAKFEAVAEKEGGGVPKPAKRLYGADLQKFLEEQGLNRKPKVTEKRVMKWEVSNNGAWIVNGKFAERSTAGNISASNEQKADKALKITKGHIEKLKHTEVVQNAAMFGSASKKGQNCLTCGAAIDGTAVTTKEGLYHPDCFACGRCSKPISGPFVRAMDAKFHQECFGCTTCGCPLSETFYIHEESPYCRDHFLDVSADRCRSCTKVIEQEFVFGINEWKYHVGCFKCEVCAKPLEQYFVKDDKAFCLEDFLSQFGEDCAKCGTKISGAMHAVDGVAAAEGLKWHTECFTCCVCAKHLEDEVFFHEGLLYCRDDLYNTFASRCKACGETIEGPCVNAMDNVWHPQCFKCRECGILLEGSFMMKDDVPYCKADFMKLFAEKCYGCKQPVSGNIINAIGHKWHPQCFKCRVRAGMCT